jgi:hypothetical protein
MEAQENNKKFQLENLFNVKDKGSVKEIANFRMGAN